MPKEIITTEIIMIETRHFKHLLASLYVECEDFVPHWVQILVDVLRLLLCLNVPKLEHHVWI